MKTDVMQIGMIFAITICVYMLFKIIKDVQNEVKVLKRDFIRMAQIQTAMNQPPPHMQFFPLKPSMNSCTISKIIDPTEIKEKPIEICENDVNDDVKDNVKNDVKNDVKTT